MSGPRTLPKILIAGTLGLTLTGTASAQVFVIGTGLGSDCYERTKNAVAGDRNSEETCTRALREESMTTANRAATYVNRGVLLMRKGKYDEALADYANAKRLKPDLGEAYLNEGAAYIYKRDYASALISLDRSIDLDVAEAFAAHYNRAIARENTGDVPGAYADFKRSLELKPDWGLAVQQLDRFEVRSTTSTNG